MRHAIVSVVSFVFISCTLTSLADAIEVEVYKPQQTPHHLTLELSGSVVAEQDSQLSSLEAGLVKAIFVDAGDKVVTGQKLLALDNTLAQLRLSQEQSDYQSALVQQQEAQRQYHEVVSLSKNKLVADSLLAERKANLASAQSQLSNSRARVALQKEIVQRHILSAPFDGTIARRNVNLGEWIAQQSLIFRLVSDQQLRLLVDLPQEYLKAIANKPQLKVLVIPDAMPNSQYQLAITQLVPVANASSRTVKIRIDLPTNTDIMPGMSARVRLNLSDETGSDISSDTRSDSSSNFGASTLSWIPRTALKQHPDGSHSVFTVHTVSNSADNKTNQALAKVKRRKIKLIQNNLDQVAVTGLPNNSTVVVSGTELLKDNQLVKPVFRKNNQDTGSR
jgi:RND family efflux transporter MFP subunit